MDKKKKLFLAIGIAAAVIIIAVIIIIAVHKSGSSGDSGEDVYVSSIADITGNNGVGSVNRYAGVIEPQETKEIQKSSDKTVKEVLVSEGDEVKVGTPLFSYDTEEMSMKLSQAELDLESLNNDINSYNNQITTLEKEKASASANDKLNYTIQIQEVQNDILRAEYNKKSKNIEIEQLKKSLDNATVLSEIDGVVKSINENGDTDSSTGEVKPFMTIMATGNYRVKGTVNENNINTLSESMPVVIRSRLDSSVTWTGVISKIDYENQEQNNNNGMMMSDGGNNTSSKYPFYVELDGADGLMLGQHVFIEPNYGQNEQRDGIWLMESYFVFDGNDAYVWAMNSRNKLEKRKVELGEYDENLMEYEVVSGLSKEDCIAWPNDSLQEGLKCTVTSVDAMISQGISNDTSGNDHNNDGTMDDGMINDGSADDGSMNDGAIDDGSMDGGSMDGGSMDDGSMDDGSVDGSSIDGSEPVAETEG